MITPFARLRTASRLREIKASYDPDQAIISAHPVWPSRGDTRPNNSHGNEMES